MATIGIMLMVFLSFGIDLINNKISDPFLRLAFTISKPLYNGKLSFCSYRERAQAWRY
jgi:hypothetical protein